LPFHVSISAMLAFRITQEIIGKLKSKCTENTSQTHKYNIITIFFCFFHFILKKNPHLKAWDIEIIDRLGYKKCFCTHSASCYFWLSHINKIYLVCFNKLMRLLCIDWIFISDFFGKQFFFATKCCWCQSSYGTLLSRTVETLFV